MKDLKLILNEAKDPNKGAAKDLHKPRKGSTIYMMKVGETKSYKVRVEDVWMQKTSDPGIKDIYIKFEENPLEVSLLMNIHFPGHPEFYAKPQLATIESFPNIGSVYLGVTKDAITNFIKSKGTKKLESVIKQIEKLQKELEELNKEKAEAENEINIEITESLKIFN